jgi:hypothetical protein
MEEEAIGAKEELQDTEDYLGYLKKGNEEGMVDELPLVREGMDEDEVMRLALTASQQKPTAPPTKGQRGTDRTGCPHQLSAFAP